MARENHHSSTAAAECGPVEAFRRQTARFVLNDKGEGTQRGTALGVVGGHGSLQKERLDLGFLGSLAEARRTSEQEYFSRTVVRNSRQNSRQIRSCFSFRLLTMSRVCSVLVNTDHQVSRLHGDARLRW
jgi:hypothetical protein